MFYVFAPCTVESILYDILGPIFETNWTRPIQRSLMSRVLKTILGVKTYHTLYIIVRTVKYAARQL